MRSKAERSTMRSLITGNALALKGSMAMVSPSLKLRMCNWQVVTIRSGPCGSPLICKEQDPQIPSLQSWSNSTGVSPLLIKPSFKTSSISKKDMSPSIPSIG